MLGIKIKQIILDYTTVILFFEYGRLGNQLFQYCGLRQYFPGHNFVLVGFEDLQRNFDSVEARFISKSALGSWFSFGFLQRIVSFLVSARILGQIKEDEKYEVFKLTVRKGLLWNIYVPQNVFFQHCDVVDQIQITPFLKPELIQLAHHWLRYKRINPNSDSLIFVHIRRGDYLNWPSKKFPAVLNLLWYKQAMRRMQERFNNPVFILMSDDLFYLRDVFEESDTLIISDNFPEIDMAIMSICHSGILSASSFAWWGAFFSRLNQKQHRIFLAPQYWIGHRAKKWAPTKFLTNWINYVE